MSELTKALSEIMAEVGYVQKDAKNDHHKYKYASADAVLTKVRAACSSRGIAITETTAYVMEYHPSEGKARAVVQLSQAYRLGDETATFMGLGEGTDKGDKAVMKANTAALKYLLSLAFNISWGDDPEADPSTDAPATGGKKPIPPADDLSASIQAASTLEELEALKKTVAAAKNKALVAEFKARREELKQ